MALPPSTANWHWKNKNVTRWATEWFERELTMISVSGDKEGEIISISNVSEVDGDVELGQRKSKLITIFDCNVKMSWKGTTSDGTEVSGTLNIPEVSHEIICDKLSDFVFNWTLSTASSPEVNSLFQLAKSRLPTAIEAKLATLPSAIVEVHGRDLTVSTDPSRSGTPVPANGASTPAVASTSSGATSRAPVKKADSDKKSVNTSTVAVEATFQASADDLYGLLTDEKKIPMWTRAPAVSLAQPGTEYSLFGGGVKGKYASLTPSKEIVQTWALQSPTWPSGHSATLTTTLDQSTDSTKVTFSLAGVPVSMEDEIRRNVEGYYVHGFKSIGYVQIVPTQPVYSSEYIQKQSKMARLSPRRKTSASSTSAYVQVAVIGVLVLAAAIFIPYLSSSSLPRPSPSAK